MESYSHEQCNFVVGSEEQSPYGWSLHVTKTGYTPISYSYIYGNSTATMFHEENGASYKGTLDLAGFTTDRNIINTFKLIVTWAKI